MSSTFNCNEQKLPISIQVIQPNNSNSNQIQSLNNLSNEIEQNINTILDQFKNMMLSNIVRQMTNEFKRMLQKKVHLIDLLCANKKRRLSKSTSSSTHHPSNEFSYRSINASSNTNQATVNFLLKDLQEYKDKPDTFTKDKYDIRVIMNNYHQIIGNNNLNDLQCDPISCKIFQRQKRLKNKPYCSILNTIQHEMDFIHINIYHSYDLGYKINEKEIYTKHQQHLVLNSTKMNQIQLSKRPLLSQLRGEDNLNKNRFNSNDKRNNYSFGIRYYYWDEYKDAEMYIKKKFYNFKEEILCNHQTNCDTYEHIREIACEKWRYKLAQQQTAQVSRYGIQKGNIISIHHIMAVYMYCGFDSLCIKFTETFRRINKNESNESLKKRNSNYYWLSRYLHETVNVFGCTFGETVIKTYFRGITQQLTFDLFIVKLKAPVSTSTALAVASIFSGANGIIAEFGEYSPNLRYFNCSWISNYPSEEERLFFGGDSCIQINNLRFKKLNRGYIKIIITAIKHFQCLIRGSEYHTFTNQINEFDDNSILLPKDDVTRYDQLIINELIDAYLGKKQNVFPKNVNNIFEMFCKRRKKVRIDIGNMCNYFDPFTSILTAKDDNNNFFNLIQFDKLISLFPNINIIKIHDSTLLEVIPQKYMNYLEQIIRNIKNNANLKCIHLMMMI